MRTLEESEINKLINENAEELAKMSGAAFMKGIEGLTNSETPIEQIKAMGEIVNDIGDSLQRMFPDLTFSSLGAMAAKLARFNSMVYNNVAQENAEKGS